LQKMQVRLQKILWWSWQSCKLDCEYAACIAHIRVVCKVCCGRAGYKHIPPRSSTIHHVSPTSHK